LFALVDGSVKFSTKGSAGQTVVSIVPPVATAA
jgi:ribosomal protein L27